MHYELSLINRIIKNHLTQDNDLNEQLGQLCINITNFIQVACKGRSSLYISKSMVFALHKIANSSDTEFNSWASNLKDTCDILMHLRLLNKNALCHAAIVQLQRVFSGRSVGLAAEIAEQANDKFLRFSQPDQSGVPAVDLAALRKNAEQTRKDFDKTSEFCVTYRI